MTADDLMALADALVDWRTSLVLMPAHASADRAEEMHEQLHVAKDALRAALEAVVADARRWQFFCQHAAEENLESDNLCIETTPSGYNGGPWARAEMSLKHPAWQPWTKADMDAAIDVAIDTMRADAQKGGAA